MECLTTIDERVEQSSRQNLYMLATVVIVVCPYLKRKIDVQKLGIEEMNKLGEKTDAMRQRTVDRAWANMAKRALKWTSMDQTAQMPLRVHRRTANKTLRALSHSTRRRRTDVITWRLKNLPIWRDNLLLLLLLRFAASHFQPRHVERPWEKQSTPAVGARRPDFFCTNSIVG